MMMIKKQRYVEKKIVERKKHVRKRIEKKKKKKGDNRKEKERRKIDHAMQYQKDPALNKGSKTYMNVKEEEGNHIYKGRTKSHNIE